MLEAARASIVGAFIPRPSVCGSKEISIHKRSPASPNVPQALRNRVIDNLVSFGSRTGEIRRRKRRSCPITETCKESCLGHIVACVGSLARASLSRRTKSRNPFISCVPYVSSGKRSGTGDIMRDNPFELRKIIWNCCICGGTFHHIGEVSLNAAFVIVRSICETCTPIPRAGYLTPFVQSEPSGRQ